MKNIETDGITYIEALRDKSNEWYYGISYEHGDLYEAEEDFKEGHDIEGRNLILIHYPDGEVFRPVPKQTGIYPAEPVYYEGSIYILVVDFLKDQIRIICFDCDTRQNRMLTEFPLSSVKDCYNLSIDTAPLTVTRQRVGTNEFEIVWPERVSFQMGDHDSFYLRDGNSLYFNRWYEEGDGADYKYWEETIVRDLTGNIIDTYSGTLMQMPNGEIWHLK